MFFLKRFKVEESSMMPGIRPGDYVVVNTLLYRFRSPKKGEVIVLRHGGMNMVKRISHTEDDGSYFVLGDNQKESSDSRMFGSIRRSDITGKVVWVAK